MSHRKAKSAPKIFETNPDKLRNIVLKTMRRISDAVGSSLGPGGKPSLIESDLPGIPNTITKDGVTIFRSLGSANAYEHLIIESARDVATRTVQEAGDGTTTATVLAHALVENLFKYCSENRKESPQRISRRVSKVTREVLVPYIQSRSIAIGEENKELLYNVAKISANGDSELAAAVIKAFDIIGYGDSSHVTIRQLSGPHRYDVSKIDGFPVPTGYEESIGKFHTAFINDQANQRCYLEKPLFLLFDGYINDIINVVPLLESLGNMYVNEGSSDYKNLVIFSHGFSENVLTTLALNFSNPNTINVLPMTTPMAQFINSQLHFLHDLSAFTGAKVFGLTEPIHKASLEDLGGRMESFEAQRFRSTVVGDSDPTLIELRADELKHQKKNAESKAEILWLDERIGKITNGIAKLTIYGGSQGELKEIFDRAEDSICAVRSAISSGAVPGGCRVAIDMALKLGEELKEGDPAREVLMASLLALPNRLLDNAGYSNEEAQEILAHLVNNPDDVYDVENQAYGRAIDMGLFDATKAVEESLLNAVSIAGVLGTLGGVVCHPRDDVFERDEARLDSEFDRAVSNPGQYQNEADLRG